MNRVHRLWCCKKVESIRVNLKCHVGTMEKRGPELGSGHFLLFFFDYGVYPRFLFFYSKCHAIISYALKRNKNYSDLPSKHVQKEEGMIKYKYLHIRHRYIQARCYTIIAFSPY